MSFSNPSNPATGNDPYRVVAGDFNGDGIPDLAAVNSNDQTVTILLGNGDGTFTSKLVSMPTPANFIVAGDFNGDGVLDLAVTGSTGTGNVLLGNGDGTLKAVAMSSGYLMLGDFNGDGILDIVSLSEDSGTVSVLLGNEDGTFKTWGSVPVPATLHSGIVVADFNGDGVLDLAVSSTSTSYMVTQPGIVTILLGNGDGMSFLRKPTFSRPSSFSMKL